MLAAPQHSTQASGEDGVRWRQDGVQEREKGIGDTLKCKGFLFEGRK